MGTFVSASPARLPSLPSPPSMPRAIRKSLQGGRRGPEVSRSQSADPGSSAPSDAPAAARTGPEGAGGFGQVGEKGGPRCSSRPSATHPQRPRACRPGAPGAAPLRARPERPGGDNGIPGSRSGLCGLWFAPKAARSLLQSGRSARGNLPPAPGPSPDRTLTPSGYDGPACERLPQI